MDEILNLIESVSEGFPSYICYSGDHNALDHIRKDIATCNIEEPKQKYRLGMNLFFKL